MAEYKWIGKRIPRKDGAAKATGRMKYMADICLENMAYVKLLHPPVQHALIKSLDASEAEKMPGVVKVVTWKDVPGMNEHGLICKDQPVFCADRVRYLGDTVAAVIAETEAEAARALKYIRVEYEALPVIPSAAEGMSEGAPKIHPGGNIIAHYDFSSGDVERAFAEAAVVAEHVYTTKYQEHAYLETEGGVACLTKDGGIEIWMASQNCMRVRRDLVSILNIPLEKVVVHSNPLGGAFGGKDDLLLQGILCVCALAAGRPVKVVLSREESYLLSPKRVPFEITIKMAAAEDGTFTANKVYARATGGPYASYVGAILSFALESACGFYYYPNTDISGDAVYTNGCYTSAFRGFGNNQMNFAVENMIDILAEKLGLDTITIRRKNCLKADMRHSYNQLLSPGAYADATLRILEETWLWQNREEFKAGASQPWLKRGVGLAGCQQGVGLGNACYPDSSACDVELTTDGRLLVYFSNEDMGQGSCTTLLIIAAEAAHMPLDCIDAVTGDTRLTPDSGPITASRTTYISGLAIMDAIAKLHSEIAVLLDMKMEELRFDDDGVNSVGWGEIARRLGPERRRQNATREFRDTDVQISFGLHYIQSHLSQIVGVEVNTLTGQTRVLRTDIAPAAGTIINPLGFEGQCEGGAVMSLGYALLENFETDSTGRPLTRNFQTYLLPTITDMPDMTIYPVTDAEESGPFGARGLAEQVSVPGTAAIIGAVYDAVGVRVFDLPCSQERLLKALGAQRKHVV
jgi:CO/xanthine dehydrogenase Mo-binding subunit